MFGYFVLFYFNPLRKKDFLLHPSFFATHYIYLALLLRWLRERERARHWRYYAFYGCSGITKLRVLEALLTLVI